MLEMRQMDKELAGEKQKHRVYRGRWGGRELVGETRKYCRLCQMERYREEAEEIERLRSVRLQL